MNGFLMMGKASINGQEWILWMGKASINGSSMNLQFVFHWQVGMGSASPVHDEQMVGAAGEKQMTQNKHPFESC